jgi:hypothetical protein
MRYLKKMTAARWYRQIGAITSTEKDDSSMG